MQRVRTREVGHIFTATAQKAKILYPLNWRADIAVDEAHLRVLAKPRGPRLHPISRIDEFLARRWGRWIPSTAIAGAAPPARGGLAVVKRFGVPEGKSEVGYPFYSSTSSMHR